MALANECGGHSHSTTVRDVGVLIDCDVAVRSHVSRTVSGCFAVLDSSATSDAQCQILCSIRWSCRWLCHVSTTATQHSQDFLHLSSVDFSRFSIHRQTYTSIFSVWARHTNAARPTLAAVSGTHRFQVSCAHLPMPAWHGTTVSFRLHPEHRRFQPSPSPVIVILAASDPTYTAVHCWWSCISGCRMQPLEQSAARRHLSFNAVCFSKPPQNSSLFPIISFLTVFRFLVLHTVYSSGLAVFFTLFTVFLL